MSRPGEIAYTNVTPLSEAPRIKSRSSSKNINVQKLAKIITKTFSFRNKIFYSFTLNTL